MSSWRSKSNGFLPAVAQVLGSREPRARGMAQMAKDTGISREGLYKALSPEGNPSLATVLKVVKALGLKLTAKVRRRLSLCAVLEPWFSM